MKTILPAVVLLPLLLSCSTRTEHKTIGSIERIDPALDQIIAEGAVIEVIGEGYEWSEGPVWIEDRKLLLFSDVPANKIYQWTEENGVTPFLTPSGYTGEAQRYSREPGSNGLLLNHEGKLVLCQHGDRRIAQLRADYADPTPVFTTIADRYDGKRFNSPNDAVYHSNGDLFFTDPPYGLPRQEEDSTRELPFHGVFKVAPSGEVTLLLDTLSRPNGIALTADEKAIIIANSDPTKPVWYAYDLTVDHTLSNGRIFFDAIDFTAEPGPPDGLKIDKNGNVFATGPGGVWIFNGQGRRIGMIRLPEAAANCALADEDRTLYITSRQYLLRVKMR